MKSQTSLVAQQTRLNQWAERIREVLAIWRLQLSKAQDLTLTFLKEGASLNNYFLVILRQPTRYMTKQSSYVILFLSLLDKTK